MDEAGDAARALAATYEELERAGVAVAALRAPARDGRGVLEADVLVDPADLRRAEETLVAQGFRRRPAWGRSPHRAHLRPVAASGTDGSTDWLKVDLVTDLCFGPRHQWPTGLGAACLRDRDGEGRPPRLAPADELVAHLLHALLDRGALRASDRAALVELAGAVDGPGLLARELAPPSGPASFPALVDVVVAGCWDAVEDAAPELRRRVVARHRVRGAGRSATSLVLRHAGRALRPLAPHGRLVAVVGTDGTGKSTLVSALEGTVGVPCRVGYGGTYRSGASSSVPGLATARVVVRLLRARAAATWHRWMGRLVLLDRHPEEARPLPTDRMGARARLRRRALAATLPAPDLTVVLDAPPEVLAGRRPEHSVAHLARDRDRHLALRPRGGALVVLDAARPPDLVRADALELIWRRAVPTGVRGVAAGVTAS